MDKVNLKKINDVTWEIPKEGNMNVTGRIFVSEKLLELIKGDKSIEQVKNVAAMPGILKHSFAMPDMHMGYGFSIGGVAAFDSETGIITPGGIGFDINCLTKNSKILTEYGYFKPIQEFEQDFFEIDNPNSDYILKSRITKNKLISLDIDQKSFSPKEAVYFMKKKYSDSIYEIKTKLGYEIQVTKDHPVLTKIGMVKAENVVKDLNIAILPFKGVKYEKLDNRNLVNEDIFTTQQKAELEKRDLLPFGLENPKLPIITKLFGYLMGDGTIYVSENKGFVNAYGPKNDLKQIQKDIEHLGFSAKIYSRQRQHNIPTKYGNVEFESVTHELHCASKSLAKLFFELGYPQGNKTATLFLVPDWIINSPLWIKRLFLSGLFGAELSKPRTHTKTGFDCPTLSINKNSNLLENVREYAIQIMQLLEDFGVETHKLLQRKDYVNKHGQTHRLKIQISSREENLLNLYEKIGFSYNTKRENLANIAILYIKNKQILTQKRKEIANKTKELKKKGLTLKEVQKLLVSKITNSRFIERHYYENAGQRINLSFQSFDTFVTEKKKEIAEYGCLFDSIELISKRLYDDFVYDFNVKDTHTFVSDNVIVSNCGVRVLASNFKKEDVEEKISILLEELFKRVPCGVGKDSEIRLDDKELEKVMLKGAKWAVDNGYGNKEDLIHCESNGVLDWADPNKVTSKAKARGKRQLGTLGAGNHFLEIQYVDKIYQPEIATKFGIKEEGQVVIMIHCGSRGFGHQICTDYLRRMEDEYAELIARLPEKDLAYAPFKSKLGQDYFGAMACAANFAWANRHIIGHQIRKAFERVFENSELKTVYDVAHNIAKIEEHNVNGKKQKVIVHRKGATRCFPAGHKEIPEAYRDVGHPVLIPGSMGTASYILVGMPGTMDIAFGSTAHGAGRVMSRKQANQMFKGESVKKELKEKNILIKSASWRGVSEEAPGVYKDIDEVIKVTEKAGISKPVARLKPMGVIKG
ncbi:MAG: RtcB family protein [Nanoarchaeota archaeon]